MKAFKSQPEPHTSLFSLSIGQNAITQLYLVKRKAGKLEISSIPKRKRKWVLMTQTSVTDIILDKQDS